LSKPAVCECEGGSRPVEPLRPDQERLGCALHRQSQEGSNRRHGSAMRRTGLGSIIPAKCLQQINSVTAGKICAAILWRACPRRASCPGTNPNKIVVSRRCRRRHCMTPRDTPASICDPKFVTYISLNWDRNGYAPNVWFALLATAGNAVTNAALSGTVSPRAMSVIAFVNSASDL
jgi:hypothetical protein